MAGNLFRATQRTGGLQPVLDLFRSVQQQRDKNDYYNRLADLASRTQKNISEIKGGFDPNMTFMPGRESSVNQAQPFDTKNLLGIDPNLISDTPQVPLRPSKPQEPQIDAGTPGDYLLGDALLNQEGTGYDRKKMYNLAGDELRNSLLQMISDENADLPRVNALGNLLGSEVESMKPSLQRTNVPYGTMQIVTDNDGNEVDRILNEREPKQTTNPQDNSAWASLFYRKQKDEEDRKEKQEKISEDKKTLQGQYNSIMGSPYLTVEELLSQGLIDRNHPAISKRDKEGNRSDKREYGGAYVVRDANGKPQLFFSGSDLESYAKSKVSKAPNKWGRPKKGKTENSEKKPRPY